MQRFLSVSVENDNDFHNLTWLVRIVTFSAERYFDDGISIFLEIPIRFLPAAIVLTYGKAF